MTFISAVLIGVAFAQATALQVPAKYLKPRPAPDAVLAKVNGSPITAAEIEDLLWDWRAFEVVQDAITHRVLMDEAQRLKVTVAEAQIEAELTRQLDAARKSLRPGETLERGLLLQGFPLSRLYLRVRSQLLLDAIALRDFSPAAMVSVSTIVIPTKSDLAADIAEAIKQAEAAYAELKKGTPWDTVLKRFHTDPKILSSHGKIGWRSLALFPEATQKELGGLKIGGVTKPAQTPNGFQIFRLDAIGKDVKGAELEALKEEFLAGTRQSTLDRIRKAARIEEFFPTGGGNLTL